MKKHDPCCPTHQSNSGWLIPVQECGECEAIAKARADQTAKCIAAVEAIQDGDPLSRGVITDEDDLDTAIAALRALGYGAE